MLLAPRPDTTAADLLRLLAFWLMLVLAAQGVAAAWALAQGPLHRHRDVPAHGHDHAHSHDLSHATGERHHHAADDANVVMQRGDAGDIDVAAFALTAALALLASAAALGWHADSARKHVRPQAAGAHGPSAWRRRPLRPPRRA